MLTKRFFLGGNSIFTISNPQGEYYTYKIRRKEFTANPNIFYFVFILTGPDNNSNYTYMGKLDADRGYVKPTAKSKYNSGSKPMRIINWALPILWFEKSLPEGYKIQHEGKCGRCGHTLTVPESIESGIGPECSKRMGLVPVA